MWRKCWVYIGKNILFLLDSNFAVSVRINHGAKQNSQSHQTLPDLNIKQVKLDVIINIHGNMKQRISFFFSNFGARFSLRWAQFLSSEVRWTEWNVSLLGLIVVALKFKTKHRRFNVRVIWHVLLHLKKDTLNALNSLTAQWPLRKKASDEKFWMFGNIFLVQFLIPRLHRYILLLLKVECLQLPSMWDVCKKPLVTFSSNCYDQF